MSRADTCTLLSLSRYAKLMGINPVHFEGAAGTDVFPLRGGCSDVWWQRTYMGADKVSREDLAMAIGQAEEDIADYLGFWPAPKWFARELHPYPRPARRDLFGTPYNVRGDAHSLKLRWGKFIAAGRQAWQLVGHPSTGGGTMVWSDPDADGFDELMTITLPTTLTSASVGQIRVYEWQHQGECEYEIRCPEMTVDITAGVLTITLPFWACIDPALQDPYPNTAGPTALNIVDPIYIIRCSVYREYTDYTQHSVEFYWESRDCCTLCGGLASGGATCPHCELHVQCGCLYPRNNELGIAVPTPGTWSSSDAEWGSDEFDRCEPPDQVKVWYYAGQLSDRYLAGKSRDPLSDWWAQTIAWLATARLERNFCACGNLTALASELRAEMGGTDRQGRTFFLAARDQENPFGTRKGELMAWKRVNRLAERIPSVALV